MWWSERMRALLILAAATLLTACGFRLQGSQIFPPVMATTHIAAQDRYSEFYLSLRDALEQGGVTVSDSVVACRHSYPH